MSEPTTSLDYDAIRRHIGRELGWNRDPYQWETDQVTDAADMIAAGCRAAYYPPDGQVWSFLNIEFAITTASGKREYELPDDAASIVGTLTYTEDDGNAANVHIVSDQMIRARYQNQAVSSTGYPIEACLRFRRPNDSQSTRAVLAVWPEPDGTYTMHGQCVVQPNTLTAERPWPYGGPAFHECLLNAILWEVERHLGENDGKYAQDFATSLASAKKVDGQNTPQRLGYNDNGSGCFDRRDVRPGLVTYTPS